jgi:DnaD/phage-associated family protein
MPEAHGDYVKVYLYLLRCLDNRTSDFSISSLAEYFGNTEKDILKAIGYWEQKGLLAMERSETGAIQEISLLKPPPAENPAAKTAEKTKADFNRKPDTVSAAGRKAPAGAGMRQEEVPAAFPRPTYTAEQIAHMKEDSQVRWLLENIERYLKRLLKPADIQLVLYLYESLNFPPDLILYLYEYCISMNKAHRSYLEAVALNWHRDGIRTVEQAAMTTSQYKKEYYTIAKALGFQRALADAEFSFIEKWLHAWGFPLEVVLEACKRTVLQIQNPNFQYADRILESWHKEGAHTLPEIKKLDDAFSRSTAAKQKQAEQKALTPQRTQPAQRAKKKNSFSSFSQYDYSSDEFSRMEKALLNKSAQKVTKDGD